MTGLKPWWKSKTIWASIFSAIVAGFSSYYGSTNPGVAALIAVGSALGIYGRVLAETNISTSARVTAMSSVKRGR